MRLWKNYQIQIKAVRMERGLRLNCAFLPESSDK